MYLLTLEKEMATHSGVLSGESQGRGSLVGCRLWGRTESDMTEATWQQQEPDIILLNNISYLMGSMQHFIEAKRNLF